MDIFQKIAKEQPLDFRVFQNKKTHIRIRNLNCRMNKLP